MIVHLLGWPGVGKLTVARALARTTQGSASPLIVVDNHLTSRPILGVVDADGVADLPPDVWGYVTDIRAIVYRAIERLAPEHVSFVFTNVLVQSDPTSLAVVDRLMQLASARRTRYIPILLGADPDRLVERVDSPGRSVDRKWVDAEAVLRYTVDEQLVEPDGVVRVDTSELTPDETAEVILDLIAGHPGDAASISPQG